MTYNNVDERDVIFFLVEVPTPVAMVISCSSDERLSTSFSRRVNPYHRYNFGKPYMVISRPKASVRTLHAP